MSDESRQHSRRHVKVIVRARDGMIGAKNVSAQLRFEAGDLSLGGAFLCSDYLLEPEEPLALELDIEGVATPVRIQADVVWARLSPGPGQPAGMGVRFLSMSAEAAEILRRYLATS